MQCTLFATESRGRAVPGAKDLRLGWPNGARTDEGGIATAIVGEQYIYGDGPLPGKNIATHEIKAMRTQGNSLTLLSPFNNHFLTFPSRNGRRRGHRRGHRHGATRGTLPTLRSKPTIRSSTQSFSFILPPLNILTTF